jgi:hypothetical protein
MSDWWSGRRGIGEDEACEVIGVRRRHWPGPSSRGDWGKWARVSVPGMSPFIPHGKKNERPRCTSDKIRRPTSVNRCEAPYGGHLLYLLILFDGYTVKI